MYAAVSLAQTRTFSPVVSSERGSLASSQAKMVGSSQYGRWL
jgi:hypothetical protein